jgi:hypothetical protein
MKTKLIYLLLLISPILLVAQTPNPTSSYLDINNYNALIYSESNFFWDHQGNPQCEIPKLSGKHTVFCHDLWIGGLDTNDSLHFAGQRYMANGKDYFFGPVADAYDTNYDLKYNKVWKVNKFEIDDHMLNYNNVGYVTPASIADWPGNGDVSNGEPAFLAPYVDVNSNGIYDPGNGDYPYIKGDQALYVIFNDARSNHMESGGEKLFFDIHAMIYGFNSSNFLNNTFFISYKIVNRSLENYHDTKIGIYTDFDLGDAFDDFIGCDSLRNMYYGYNGDSIDGDGTGVTYGGSPPAQGVVLLNQSMDRFVSILNTGGPQSDPELAVEYYNYMNGLWLDGSPVTYGGSGHGGTIPTNYMYSGSVVDTSEWSEVSESHTPYDRRGLAVIDKGLFQYNDEFCFDIAYVWGRTQSGNQNESVDIVKYCVDSVQNYYDTNILSCQWWPNDVEEVHKKDDQVLIYPNPASDILSIHIIEQIEKVVMYDLSGKVVLHTSNSTLDVSDILKGLYIIEILSKKDLTRHKVVIE